LGMAGMGVVRFAFPNQGGGGIVQGYMILNFDWLAETGQRV